MSNWFDELYAIIARYHSRKRPYALYRDPFAALAVLLSVFCLVFFLFVLCWTARRSAKKTFEDVKSNPRFRGEARLRNKKLQMVETESLLEAEEGRASFSIQSKESLDVVRYNAAEQTDDGDNDAEPLVAPVPSSSNAHKIPRKPIWKKNSLGKQVRFSTIIEKFEQLSDQDNGNDGSFEDISDELLVNDKRSSTNEKQMRDLYLH